MARARPFLLLRGSETGLPPRRRWWPSGQASGVGEGGGGRGGAGRPLASYIWPGHVVVAAAINDPRDAAADERRSTQDL